MMKRILTLLCLCIFCAVNMVHAQNVFMNAPDTVCMSTNNATSDQIKFTSVNGVTQNVSSPTNKGNWVITTPSGTDADYEILYSDNNSPNKATKLTNTQGLTIQFLKPGTYTLQVTMPYTKNGKSLTVASPVHKIVAVDCTISTCSGGNATMPGFTENFGTIPSNQTYIKYPIDGVVGYNYDPGNAANKNLPDDGYVLAANTQQRGDWVSVKDHTGNANGAMLVCNSANDPRKFYETKVTGLCRGAVYNFSAWMLDVDGPPTFNGTCVTGFIYAGVTFQVVDANNPSTVLATFNTHDISMKLGTGDGSAAATWQRFGGSFVVPSGVTDVLVRITNNKPGGCGNDIAIDDISFTYCSPVITSKIVTDDPDKTGAEFVCEGAPLQITSNYIPTDYFVNPAYQWEWSSDGGISWENVPFGITNQPMLDIAAGELKGTRTVAADYLFRVRIFESGSDATTCAAPSTPVKITILPMPQLALSKVVVCANTEVIVTASGGFDGYYWDDDPTITDPQRVLVPPTGGPITVGVTGYVKYGEDQICTDHNTTTINVAEPPEVTIHTDQTDVCEGTPVLLSIPSIIDTIAGISVKWYQGVGPSAVPLPDFDGQYQIQVQPTVANNVYSVVVETPACSAVTGSFTVNVTAVPLANAGPDITVCASSATSATLNATPVQAGQTGKWTVASVQGPGVIPDPITGAVNNADYVQLPLNPQNKPNLKINFKGKANITVTMLWTVTANNNGDCASSDEMTVTYLGNPTAAAAGRDTTQCGTGNNVFHMGANPVNVDLNGTIAQEIGFWKVVSTDSIGVTIADRNDPNTTVTFTTPKDVSLSWTIYDGASCPPQPDTVVLHYKALPSITLKTVATICNTATSFQIDTASTSGLPTYGSITAASPAMPGFVAVPDDTLIWPKTITIPANTLPGSYKFNLNYHAVTGAATCANTTTFTVNVESPSTAPTSMTIDQPNLCGGGTNIKLTAIGGSPGKHADGSPNAQYAWYAGSCGGTLLGTTSGTTFTVPGPVTATTTYYVRLEGTGPCANTSCASATVTVAAKPADADAGPDQAHCSDSAFFMGAKAATVGTGTWSVTPATAATFTNINDPLTKVILNVPTATLTWTIQNVNGSAVCSTSDIVVLTNNKRPVANAGIDQFHCAVPTFTVTGNTPPTGATVQWAVKAGTGNATFTTATNLATAGVTLTTDSVVLTYTITVAAGCSSTDEVKLVSYKQPTTANAGPDMQKCSNTDYTFTMAATPPTIGTGKWSLVSGSATIPSTDSALATAAITVKAGTTATLQWTTTNGTCKTSDNIILTVDKLPTPANAGPDITQCGNSTFNITGNVPTVGTGSWSIVSRTGIGGVGTGTGAAPTLTQDPTTGKAQVIIVPGNVVTLEWKTQTSASCPSVDNVVLTSLPNPTTANAGAFLAQCNNPVFTLAGNTPATGETGTWSVYSGAGVTVTQADPANPNQATANVPQGVTAVLQWKIANSGCSSTDTVTVINYAPATTANAGPDQDLCEPASFTVTGNTPVVGTGKWSAPAGINVTPIAGTTKATVTGITPGQSATITWTITNGACSSSDQVVLHSSQKPTTANAGPDKQVCSTTAYTFTTAANTPTTGTGKWTLRTGPGFGSGTATIANPTQAATAVSVPVGDTAVLDWIITNGSCTSTDEVIFINNQTPPDANAGPDQEGCGTSNFTLAGNNPVSATAPKAKGIWTIVSGTGDTTKIKFANRFSPTSAVTGVPVGTSVTLQWSLSNGTCTSTPDQVVLSNQTPVVNNVISTDQEVCPTQIPDPITGTIPTGGSGTYTYQWQISTTSATTGFTDLAGVTSPSFSPGTVTQDTWFRRVVSSGACVDNSSNAVKLTVILSGPTVVAKLPVIITDCKTGTDYTKLFGTPKFTHAPYLTATFTVDSADVTLSVTGCETHIKRTWTATDQCGQSDTTSQTIVIVDRTAPKFTAPPANLSLSCEQTIPAAADLTAIDDCQGTMTITPTEVVNRAPGACTNNYTIVRTWTATDNCGNTSTVTQTITVADKTAPQFTTTPPADITVECDKVPAKADMTATDNCGPMQTVSPVDTRQDIPGACANNYKIIRTWTATDPCGNTTVIKQTITVQDKTAPVFNITVPPSITVECDQTVGSAPVVVATDNCSPNVTVTETEKTTPGSCANSYTILRTWTAKDECGNTATMKQTVYVEDKTAPVFNIPIPTALTVNCDSVPSLPNNITATDNCSAKVKIAVSQTTKTVNGCSYQIIRTYTAKDDCGNTNTVVQTITVTDRTAPVLDAAPADITIDCGQAIPVGATIYGRDNCDKSFPKKAIMTEDPYTTDRCAGYTITRRWNISDACGNAAEERVQHITVNPCPKPLLNPDLPINCSNNTKFAILLANQVIRPKFTLVSVVPAGAVNTPITQSSNVFDLKGATEATFTVTDGITGCVSDPVTYTLQYVQKPVVDLGNNIAICDGTSTTLDAGAANAGYSILWSTGESSQTITVTQAGTYKVTVSNGGCSTTDSVKVTVNPAPVVNINDTTICDGQSAVLNAFVQGGTYQWSTAETTSSITVTTAGTYHVSVTANGCTTDKDVKVDVSPAPNVVVSANVDICPDQSTDLSVNPDGGQVLWSTGETDNNITVSRPGDYVVKVTRDACVISDTIKVGNKADINVDLGPDKDICAGNTVTLDATNPDAVSYLWTDGDTNPVKVVTSPGTYIVSVMDRFCSAITSDTVKVTVAGIPTTDLLPPDTTLCIGQTLTLKVDAGSGNSIRWQDNSNANNFVVVQSGVYTVIVYNDCGSVTDDITVTFKPCDADPQFPNAFTPNGDGKNDTFKPHVQGPMYDYDLRVYNRWGQQIFISHDSEKGWDGTYQGKPVETGTYVWMLGYKKVMGGIVNVVKGEVTVIK